MTALFQRISDKIVAAVFNLGIETNVQNIHIAAVRGKPVGAKQYPVAVVQRKLEIIGRNRFVSADGAGYLMTIRVSFYHLLGDLAAVKQILISRYLANTLVVALSKKLLRARISDIHNMSRSAENYRCYASRAHNLVDFHPRGIPNERISCNN